MSILGTLTMEQLGALRRMSRPDAELFVAQHKLEGDDRERALALAGRDLIMESPASTTTNIRRNWLAAAWLLGASFRQLGHLHDVAPQTIMSSVDRILPSPQRMKMRLVQDRISPELISEYRAQFNRSLEVLTGMTPLEIAQWLLDNTEGDSDV